MCVVVGYYKNVAKYTTLTLILTLALTLTRGALQVGVVVGYNKNVAKYTTAALVELRKCVAQGGALPQVTLQHCNEFKRGDGLVEFMSGPGAEGMLHNMCCARSEIRTRQLPSYIWSGRR